MIPIPNLKSVKQNDHEYKRRKRQARISRYEALARKAECASQSAFKQSQNAVAGIPPGQPILVGHHSEKQHRACDRTFMESHGQKRRSDT
ncbi:MAG: DUF3560 domain-containing protein [Alistipes indistinctus]